MWKLIRKKGCLILKRVLLKKKCEKTREKDGAREDKAKCISSNNVHTH